MLSLGGSHRVFLCRAAVDFRKAHDGLCAVVRDTFQDDPFSGDVFVFHNVAKDRVKLLLWDRNGFWLLYKRLEKGTFPFNGNRRLKPTLTRAGCVPQTARHETTGSAADGELARETGTRRMELGRAVAALRTSHLEAAVLE